MQAAAAAVAAVLMVSTTPLLDAVLVSYVVSTLTFLGCV
jgi:hypothetical protein